MPVRLQAIGTTFAGNCRDVSDAGNCRRRRRLLPVRVVQRFQLLVQNRFLAPALGGSSAKPPLLLVLANRFAPLRRLLASFIGIGVRAEHIHIRG